jgi:putative aldouronate transport system substrate-binding protein
MFAAIAACSDYVEEALRFMDYIWGPEGQELANWGIEGESFTRGADGQNVWMPHVMNPREGWSTHQVRGVFSWAVGQGAYRQDPRIGPSTYTHEQQGDAVFNKWTPAGISRNHLNPPVAIPAARAEEFTGIMGEVRTHRDETRAQFLMGLRPLDQFDQYLDELNRHFRFNVAFDIQRQAVEEYTNRMAAFR